MPVTLQVQSLAKNRRTLIYCNTIERSKLKVLNIVLHKIYGGSDIMENNKHPFADALTNFKQEQVDTLSVKEAADALNLSEVTIYKYIREGHLKSVESPFVDTLRITKESFQKLHENLVNAQSNGISFNALAKRFNITKSRLQQLFETHNIEIPKATHGRREQYLITEEIQKQIHDILLHEGHFPKTHFFNSRYNIALFQAFTSKINHNTYRIERNEDVWGIRTPTGILRFDTAEQQYELVPNYPLRQRARQSDTIVTLCLSMLDEKFYSIIDTVYATFGLNNLNFQYQQQDLLIYVKASKYELQTPQEQVMALQQFIINGTLTFKNRTIILESFDSTFTVTIPHALLPTLEREARKEQVSKKQYLNKMIEMMLKNKQKESEKGER